MVENKINKYIKYSTKVVNSAGTISHLAWAFITNSGEIKKDAKSGLHISSFIFSDSIQLKRSEKKKLEDDIIKHLKDFKQKYLQRKGFKRINKSDRLKSACGGATAREGTMN